MHLTYLCRPGVDCCPVILFESWYWCNRKLVWNAQRITEFCNAFPFPQISVNPEHFVHSKFSYAGDLRPFVRMKFSYSCWPLRILWLILNFWYTLYFRMEAAAYVIYENKMHAKQSGFTVSVFYDICIHYEISMWGNVRKKWGIFRMCGIDVRKRAFAEIPHIGKM